MPAALPDTYEVVDLGHDTPCWLVEHRQPTASGYTQMRDGGEKRMTHVVYYERTHGPVPEDARRALREAA